MQFTYVVRPGEAPEGRGPSCQLPWENPLNFSLRIGYILQLISYVGLLSIISSTTNYNFSLLKFFQANGQSLGSAPVGLVIILNGINIMGMLFQMAFLTISDDDGSIKHSRGFRSGVKLLTQGNTMSILSSMLTFISFYSANKYFTDVWMDSKIGNESNWLIYTSGRLTDCIYLLLLSGSIFFLEVYHSEGAGEIWGWVISIFYRLAAIFEIIYIFSSSDEYKSIFDTMYTFFLGLSLLTATLWAFLFEPISHRYDVKLTQSAMRTEYYKSCNAMAYYGPAVVDADGELELQNQQMPNLCK